MEESPKVFEFKKRYEDRFEAPIVTPKWLVTYIVNKDTETTDLVEGYLASLAPTVIVTKGEEQLKSFNDICFSIPYDRLIKLVRYVEVEVQK